MSKHNLFDPIKIKTFTPIKVDTPKFDPIKIKTFTPIKVDTFKATINIPKQDYYESRTKIGPHHVNGPFHDPLSDPYQSPKAYPGTKMNSRYLNNKSTPANVTIGHMVKNPFAR